MCRYLKCNVILGLVKPAMNLDFVTRTLLPFSLNVSPENVRSWYDGACIWNCSVLEHQT